MQNIYIVAQILGEFPPTWSFLSFHNINRTVGFKKTYEAGKNYDPLIILITVKP